MRLFLAVTISVLASCAEPEPICDEGTFYIEDLIDSCRDDGGAVSEYIDGHVLRIACDVYDPFPTTCIRQQVWAGAYDSECVIKVYDGPCPTIF